MKKNAQKVEPNPSEKLNSLMVLILLLILGIVPLIVRVAVTQAITPALGINVLNTGPKGDLFTYYKMIYLFTGTFIITVVFLYSLYRNGFVLKNNYINSLTAITFLSFLVSGFLAQYRSISFLGQADRHEGTLVYLCYLILFFIATNLVYSEKHLKWLSYPLYSYVIVNCFLGLLWFYNYNILKLEWVKSLLIPGDLLRTGGGLGAESFLVNTISNPDFSSGMGAVFAILFLTRAIFVSELKSKVINLIFATISFIMIPVSMARSGLFTLIVMLPILLLIVLFSKVRRQALLTLGGGLVLFLVVFGLLSMHNPTLLNRANTLSLNEKSTIPSEITTIVNSFNPLAAQNAYAETTVSSADDEFKLPSAGWAPGTGRLYIWKKTAQLIEKKPLFGYGMDTLPFYFPHNDPEKISGLDNIWTIVDKPHNLFFGIAFGAGILTLCAFLVLLLRHLFSNLRLVKLGISNDKRTVAIAIFTSWLAFLIQGMFNDSTIGTGPIFWILFGISVSLIHEELTKSPHA